MSDRNKPRLLVFELRMLGDAVLSFPFIRAALEHHDVFVCCPPASLDIYSMVLPRDRLIPWRPPWLEETGKYRGANWRQAGLGALIAALRRLRAAVAVSVWADSRVHLLMALAVAGERVGFPMNRQNYLAHERPWRRQQLRAGRLLAAAGSAALLRPLLTRCVDRNRIDQPHWADWRQLAETLGLPWSSEQPWIPSPPPDATPLAVRALAEAARRAGRHVWLLHPGGRLSTKRWASERWQETIDRVFTPQATPLIIVRPPEGPVLLSRHPLQVIVETQTIRELAGTVAAVDSIACNDTLVSHLGAALGKRVVAVFGSGSPDWFAPVGSESFSVRADVCPIHPCMDYCQMPSTICLEAVTVAMVEDAIRRCE